MASQRIYPSISLEEITARNETARRMIAGFWRNLDTALTDNLALSAEVTRLSGELSATRLDMANLLAAARATLAADTEGEADPLYYLRDELNARHTGSERHGRAS